MNPMVFRAVLGYRMVRRARDADGVGSFYAREAVLPGYKKVSPDNTYLYAVPDAHGRIRGLLTGPLPGDALAALRRYEGRNYRRVRVKVLTAEGPVQAVAFVGRLEELSHSFGWEFRDHLKQELLLRRRIDRALLDEEVRGLHTDEDTTRSAMWELHGRTIRDLVRQHFDGGGISSFAIARAIRDEPLRDFTPGLVSDPDAARYAPAYLAMVVKQVIFNVVEERIREEFRYELDRLGIPELFYERTVSSLAALRLLNARRAAVRLLTDRVLEQMAPATHHLIDYVRRGVEAGQKLYDSAAAGSEIRFIRDHMGRGHIPLGAELEFSNIGHDVILDPQGKVRRDEQYDGFLYFRDYALDILTWRLGGHVDDHRVKSSPQRRRGFFELAIGCLSVEADISKPITDDPWLLNQIVHAALRFYDVAPHSLHISLQLRSPRRPVQDRLMPLGAMKCLFALVGDPVCGPDGTVQIRRLASEEIIRKEPATHMLFTQVSRRRSREGEPFDVPALRGRWVQQFKFLRLSPTINYEPIIVALKGLQIHYKPGSFLTARQFQTNPRLARRFRVLRRWGCDPEPLSQREITQFLSAAHDGLMREYRGRPAHSPAYITYCLSQLRERLHEFNEFVESHRR